MTPYISGTTRSKLTKGQAEKIAIPLPPLDEQRRIAAILDKADALRRKRKRALDLLDNFLQSVFVQTCATAGAETLSLSDFAEVLGGAGFPDSYQGRKVGPIPFYKVSDMNLPGNERWMSASNNHIDSDTASELGAKIHPPGTIIFPKIGAAIATNKKRILSKPSCFDNNVVGIKIKPGKMEKEFLYSYLKSIDLMQFAQPGNPPSIRKSTLESATVNVPSIDTQRIFSSQFNSIAERSALYGEALKDLEAVFASLQHRAFSGQL